METINYEPADVAVYARMITVTPKGKKGKDKANTSYDVPVYFVARVGDKEIVPLPSGNYRAGEKLESLTEKQLRVAKLPEALLPALQKGLNAFQQGLGDDYVQALPEISEAKETKGLESLTV